MNTTGDTNPPPRPDPSTVTDTRNTLLQTAQSLVEDYGNAFDGFKDRLIPLGQGALRHGQTLHDIEERGSSISRPIPERILAQDDNGPHTDEEPEIEGIDGVIYPDRERMFVKWAGKPILRASWVDASLWRELQRGGEVREEWVRRRVLIERGQEKEFDMDKWKEIVRKDEEVRWERRALALLKRELMETLQVITAEMEDEDRDFPEDMERKFRKMEREKRREKDKEERLREVKGRRRDENVAGEAQEP